MSQSTTSPANSSNGDRTTLGVVVHFTGLIFGFIGAGVVYLTTSDEFTKLNARNAVNWWLLMFGATLVLLVLGFFLSGQGDIFVMLVTAIGVVLGVISLGFTIWAATKANSGEAWEYPLAPNLV